MRTVPGRPVVVAGVVILAMVLIAALGVVAGRLFGDGDEDTASGGGAIEASDAWISASLDIGAGYVTFENPGDDDRLVEVVTPAADSVSLMDEASHGGGHDGSGLEGFPVPAGESGLTPGEGHIMLEDLTAPLEPGDRVELELSFEQAGTRTVEAEVLDWDEVADRLEADA